MKGISDQVLQNCSKTPERRLWLARLPETIQMLLDRWSLIVNDTFAGEEVSCAWVARVKLREGGDAVLKLAMPHMEGQHEIAGLRFWNGDPTVQLLAAEESLGAMLLEYCEPGTVLRQVPESEQDRVIASLLRRLWRRPTESHPFRHLSELTAYWSRETVAQMQRWPDSGLVREGLRLFEKLPGNASSEVLLATDLHAGNVLAARREPWLVIDPKPFIGDPAYDATQHLFNCRGRLYSKPEETIRRFADLLDVDGERVRLWTFARAAAEPRDNWEEGAPMALARAIGKRAPRRGAGNIARGKRVKRA